MDSFVYDAIDGWEADADTLKDFQGLYSLKEDFVERYLSTLTTATRQEDAVVVIARLYTRYLETQNELNNEQARNDELRHQIDRELGVRS